MEDDYESPKPGIPCFGGPLDGERFDCARDEWPPGYDHRRAQGELTNKDCGGDYILRRFPMQPHFPEPSGTWPLYVYKGIDIRRLQTEIAQYAIWHWRS